jgi:hypothetical protein
MRLTGPRIVALSITLAAVGGTWFVGKLSAGPAQASAPASAPANSDKDIHALERQMDALRQEVAALSQHKDRLPDEVAQKPAETAPAGSDTRKPEETSEEDRRRAAQESHTRAVKHLERRLQKEASDPQWTSQMQREVVAAVPVESGSALRSVDCHASLCRIELAHEDRRALERFTNDLSNNLHYDMDILIEPDGESFNSMMVLSRQGQQMPDWKREMAAEEKNL